MDQRGKPSMGDELLGSVGKKKIFASDLDLRGEYIMGWTSVTKTAVLVTLAGYLEKNGVWVEGKRFYFKDNLDSYMSYLLNDKRASPRVFKLDINYSEIETRLREAKFKDVGYLLSFSGGVDSTAGLLFALDRGIKIRPVWIGFGQKNEEGELKIAENVTKKVGVKLMTVRINFGKWIEKGWVRWKMGIIPARNFLFAAIASQMATVLRTSTTQIWVCAHKEEITPINTDKSKRFFDEGSKIFSHGYGKKIVLTTPFAKVTKPEIVSYWQREWKQKFGIDPKETISCYTGNSCGICKACINRAIAFECAGVSREKYSTDPFKDKAGIIWKGYIARFDSLDRQRGLELLYALNSNRNRLPVRLRNFLDKTYQFQEHDSQKRISDIRESIIQ